VRAMAVWAFGRLASSAEQAELRSQYLPLERDMAVRAEWVSGAV
jgi:hypothetical protein